MLKILAYEKGINTFDLNQSKYKKALCKNLMKNKVWSEMYYTICSPLSTYYMRKQKQFGYTKKVNN